MKNMKVIQGLSDGNIQKTGDEFLMKSKSNVKNDIRSHNVGNSDYSKHLIQPWDIWIEYKLNPFDADIIKRVLREKVESGMTRQESRKMDYMKI